MNTDTSFVNAEELRRIVRESKTGAEDLIYIKSLMFIMRQRATRGESHLTVQVPKKFDLDAVTTRLAQLGFTIATPNMIGSREVVIGWEPLPLDDVPKRNNVLHLKNCTCHECAAGRTNHPDAIRSIVGHQPDKPVDFAQFTSNHLGDCACPICRAQRLPSRLPTNF